LAIALRYAARSDVGLVRANNQDSAYAGPHLLVVADGMGGHAGGDVASSLAIGELAPLDDESHGVDALDHLAQAVYAAHRELLTRVDEEPALAGMGTTITALLRTGNRLALAHIGDSRAYLLREGALVQITKDHTFVQTLVDEGRLTPFEAEHHPQRSVLMRVLSDVVDDVEPDLSIREARIGDRYLLCSDGLSGVVSTETLRDTLAESADPLLTCENLVQLALRAGAPDNVTCIVADVIEDAAQGDTGSFVVGAASLHQPRRGLPAGRASAAERAAALTAVGDGDEEDSHPPPAVPRSRRRVIGGSVLAVLLLLGGGFGAWRWVTGQLFVGASQGSVAVFSGLPQDLGPFSLSRVRSVAGDVKLSDLPDYARDRLLEGISVSTMDKADQIVGSYRDLAVRCQALRLAAASPSPSPSPNPSPTVTTRPSPATSAAVGAGLPSAVRSPTGSRAVALGPSTAAVPTSAPTPSPSPSPSLMVAVPTPSTTPGGYVDCGDLTP
jgi:protein phosphatase